ncbi:MAG: CvpA family protein [Actinobacteria bacterium]|jgi:membrane protein required for colicin V production|nr:MAG: CvpA family protein [Actinomycetota bacterium]
MIGGISYLDAALIAIIAVSGLVAMYRGLTREVLSILSWVAAAGACVYFVFKYRAEAQQIAEQFHAPLLVAQVAVGGIIFLVVLIVVHLITARISDTVLDSRVGAIDRILGFLFGVARGFVLVVIPFMFYAAFVPQKEQQYPWVRDAFSYPYIKTTGDSLRIILERMVPPSLMGQPEQQQGHLLQDHNNPVVAAGGKRVRVVLYPAGPAAPNA